MAKATMLNTITEVIIRGRLIYEHLNAPQNNEYTNDKDEYNTCLLVSKEDMSTLEMFSKLEKELQAPLTFVTEPDTKNPIITNNFLIKTKSRLKPEIIDLNGKATTVKNGDYVIISCNLQSYKYMNTIGTMCTLNNVLLVQVGESIQSKPTAQDSFKNIIESVDRSFIKMFTPKTTNISENVQDTTYHEGNMPEDF